MPRRYGMALGLIGAFGLGMVLGSGASGHAQQGGAGTQHRMFEIRTYTTEDGKVEAVSQWFKSDLLKLFNRHGMRTLLFSVAAEAPRSQDTFIYILAHDNLEGAKRSWDAMRADPDFQTAIKTFEGSPQGKIIVKTESIFVNPTDYSAIR